MAVIWKFGSHVDTDQIVPGRYAPYMLTDGEDVKDFAFVEAHPQFNKHALPGDVILAADNFGCGSSREYAPVALKHRQIGAIIANSFARIFFRNAVNLGIPIFEAPAIVDALPDGAVVTLDLNGGRLLAADQVYLLPPQPPFVREITAAGGIARYVRETGRFPGQ